MSDVKFNRPEPRNGLADWEKKNGGFGDFSADNLTTERKFKSNVRKIDILTCTDSNKELHALLLENLSFLQQENPDHKILVDTKGEIAKVGAECHLNTDQAIGRTRSQLVVA